jgi:predicted CopG family antitoxin
MVRPVSLSEPAFAALRKEKQATESDSDVVLRLVEAARARRKDPMSFVQRRTPPAAWDALAEALRKMDEADRRKAKARRGPRADP